MECRNDKLFSWNQAWQMWKKREAMNPRNTSLMLREHFSECGGD